MSRTLAFHDKTAWGKEKGSVDSCGDGKVSGTDAAVNRSTHLLTAVGAFSL